MKIIVALDEVSDCLNFAIRSSKIAAPSNEIIVLGNPENDKGLCEMVPCDFNSSDIIKFRSKYVHRSTNPYKFELFCIARWFAIRDYIAKFNEPVFVMDSDVMVFCDIEAQYKKFDGAEFTVTGPGGAWNVSQGISYWANAGVLDRFCQFIFKMYEDTSCKESKEYFNHFEELQAHHQPGGCCDMNISELFSQRSGIRFRNTADIVEGSTFDHNICMDYHGYQYDGRMKVFTWQNGQPYCMKSTGENVRFNVLHCIGKEQQMQWFLKEQMA